MLRRVSWCLALSLALVGCVAPSTDGDGQEAGHAQSTLPPPIVLGVAGHSFMNGWNADPDHIGAYPEGSWPSGDAPWSFASRLGAEARINAAQGGAPSSAFLPQVAELGNATLVLASFLDSQVCESLAFALGDGPTPPDFENDLRAGVQALKDRGIPVMLVTFPDVIALAAAARPPVTQDVVYHGVLQGCAAEQRVDDRQSAMNQAIVDIAAEMGVMSDQGAVYGMEWTPEMVSTQDGFHPSPAGLEAIAAVVWDAFLAQDA